MEFMPVEKDKKNFSQSFYNQNNEWEICDSNKIIIRGLFHQVLDEYLNFWRLAILRAIGMIGSFSPLLLHWIKSMMLRKLVLGRKSISINFERKIKIFKIRMMFI